MSGQSGGRLRLSKLNEQLTCKLCRGYYIDATTINECLHSFCRSCIVKYFEKNKYCPICEVRVHKSLPLFNIRPDHTLQDIVYKLVPGCYQNEMRCRREFYEKHPEAQLASMSPEARGEPIESHIYSPDESLSLSLEYFNPTLNESPIPCVESDGERSGSSTEKKQQSIRRYLRCPAAVTVFHLQKLIRAKYGLSDTHRVDVMYKEEALYGNYTLMDVMYIYHWRRKVPLHLSYRIFESSSKRQKLSDDNPEFKQTLTNAGMSNVNADEQQGNGPKREWKEVQLKISETGVMSVTGITSPDAKKVPKTESTDERKADDSVTTATTTKSTLKAEKSEQVNKRKSSDETSRLAQSSDSQKSSGETKNSEQSTSSQKTTKAATVVKNENVKVDKTVSSKNPRLNESTTSDTLDKESSKQMSSGSSSTSSTSESTSKNQEKIKNQSSGENEKNQGSTSQASGSKIDALSAKLQFQPKVGQVNNTYSKKGQKERKTILEKVLKKGDSKNEIKEKMSRTSGGGIVANLSNNKSQMSSLQSSSKAMINSQGSSSPLNTFGSCTYSTAPSVSISITSRRNSSPDRGKDSPGSSSRNENSEGSNQRLRQNNNPPSNESLANIGLNVSTALITLGQSSSSNYPYTVQDLVNSAMLKSPSKNVTSSQSGFNLQTPSMSVFSIPTSTTLKNNIFSSNNNNNSNSSNNNNQNNSGESPSTTSTTSTSGTTKLNTPKSNLEITSVYSAVPPCPDAIPISLMKPTVRKTEILAKGTNLNEICAKIGTSGSKINDICAKIGESSKERDKNKSETRTRPEIPDLLKITKKSISSSESSVQKHIPNIPNVPTYTPSNSLLMGSMDSKGNKSISVSSSSPTSGGSSSMISQSSGSMLLKSSTSTLKKQSQPIRYKTLRDPPKSWNPTLSKNDYVAAKNQAKEMQSQLVSMGSEGGSGGNRNSKSIISEPAKIFKNRNMPRYLGNPASGVKPMYGATNEGGNNKDGNKDQSSTLTGTGSTSKSSTSGVSMTKIDPKTLSPIVSSTNSPIVSPPPYSQNARSYQNTPFPRDMCRSTGSPLSPRNSPVNMLSTNPFIPSPTPNTNPRLIYSHYPSPFSDTARFPNPLIRTPIPPHSAFHSSLPPSINKLYQRTTYMPQASGSYGQNVISQPPTVQRIPPSSTHSSASPKSPKTSSSSASSTFNLAKTETQTSMNPPGSSGGDSSDVKITSSNNETSNVFNLTKTPGASASDLSKNSIASGSGNLSAGSSTSGSNNQSNLPGDKSNNQSNNQGNSSGKGKEASKESRDESSSSNKKEETPSKQKDSEKSEKKDTTNDNSEVQKTKDDKKPSVKENNSENSGLTSTNSEKPSNKVNGGLTIDYSGSSQSASDKTTEKTKSTTDDNAELPAKDKKVETLDKRVENKDNLTASESKCDELAKSGEQIQGKKSQANKAES